MRTAAVDGVHAPRRTVLFIKETVGLPMPDGSRHDGYWYASDVGGAIHAGRIDLFTGQGAALDDAADGAEPRHPDGDVCKFVFEVHFWRPILYKINI